MLILTIRTDKPEAEVGLFDSQTKLRYEVWYAHRQLSVTLLQKITDVLSQEGKTIHDLRGIVGFAGPGSFTGLRIGLTVGDTLAYALGIPIIGMQDPQWLERGIDRLLAGEHDDIVLPAYDRGAHITVQKK
ncbi:MAG TPA: tRNA (adenosine(37)-N6)-threonylcarbamoyltransferase complex dimerization subunit type 1 TsaB [Candidatus Saccharimonadales bacterium]